MKEITLKPDDGSPISAARNEGMESAGTDSEQKNFKVCNAHDVACTARAGYVCRHDGPCKQIVGNNTEQPRCPDCGSIALKFATRDYCEGDFFWCHACGCGPILFPLEMCLSIEARSAATAAIKRLRPRIEIPDIISADDLQAALEKTLFADSTPFNAEQAVNDIIGS